MRVRELAKELKVPNKVLLNKLHELGIDASTHMSALDDEAIDMARTLDFTEAPEAPAPTPPPAPEKPVKKELPPEPKAPSPVLPKPVETKTEKSKRVLPPEPKAPSPVMPNPIETKPEPPKKPRTKPAPEQKKAPAPKAAPAKPETATETKVAPAPTQAPAGKPPETPAAKPEQTPGGKPPVPQAEALTTQAVLKEAEPATEADEATKVLKFRGGVVLRDLAKMMEMRPNRVVSELMAMNVFANINAKLDFEVATAIAEKFGYTVEHEKRNEMPPAPGRQTEDEPYQDRPEDLLPRPPVVTFLGHVDHGKTSLLDRIRDTAVAKGESGGITQHIGAYTVEMGHKPITFLDTPGHAAFTAMRARGANLTDIAVIIVAADDGIMPQTREAISHAKAAGVAIMVAINKCDLPAANPDRVLQQLQAEDLSPEDWGGSTICCNVSAETGEGIEHLLEMILLQSEVLELKANPAKRAQGFVIEAQLEPGKGPTATLLVTGGTLNVGDALLCGSHWGRVRALLNDHGKQVNSAKPSTPVKCLGLAGVPDAGAEFTVMTTDKKAKTKASQTAVSLKTASLEAPRKASLDDLFTRLKETEEKIELGVIIKADTQGSVEAIVHSLNEIKSEKVSLRFIHSGTGNITSNDVLLASASNAVVLGFHVAKESGVDAVAKHEGVEVRLHQIIYELIDQMRDAMIGILGPRLEEIKRGQAQVRQIFEIGKGSVIGGCLVLKGIINAKHRVRVKRKTEVLFEGSIQSLKHFQDDVQEVREAQECGIRVRHFSDLGEGDIIEAYEIEEREQTL